MRGVAVGTLGLVVSALPLLGRRLRTLTGPQDARVEAGRGEADVTPRRDVEDARPAPSVW
ncbi:hypothetical protein [Plantactinospora sp. BB1]|uniref:hypothetical protein n=1 Tax=Plantactinospora sp. BB1 TaxID=2071627 RepID=UPI0018FE927E|nr:hypothetical protein [Plantactinospora sp. BB1]